MDHSLGNIFTFEISNIKKNTSVCSLFVYGKGNENSLSLCNANAANAARCNHPDCIEMERIFNERLDILQNATCKESMKDPNKKVLLTENQKKYEELRKGLKLY